MLHRFIASIGCIWFFCVIAVHASDTPDFAKMDVDVLRIMAEQSYKAAKEHETRARELGEIVTKLQGENLRLRAEIAKLKATINENVGSTATTKPDGDPIAEAIREKRLVVGMTESQVHQALRVNNDAEWRKASGDTGSPPKQGTWALLQSEVIETNTDRSVTYLWEWKMSTASEKKRLADRLPFYVRVVYVDGKVVRWTKANELVSASATYVK